MSMKPILFNAEMVRAILNGRKTVTRRAVKPQPILYGLLEPCWNWYGIKAPYEVGDILYVRETWQDLGSHYTYKADEGSVQKGHDAFLVRSWRPSIHMPKEAARIFLRVTDVIVERLQDIENNNEEARREGFDWQYIDNDFSVQIPPWVNFSVCWNDNFKKSDLAKYGWDANPWVWVIEFEQISKEDAIND